MVAKALVPVTQQQVTHSAPKTTTARPRLDSVDLLRGMVMVLMALDHVRDFFTNVAFDPLDLTKTNAALFMTRWITHFCAPVYIFLAGTGAFLAAQRGRTKSDLAWFLLTRGLWLAFLEATYVRWFGWEFGFDFHNVGLAVLWAIGWSMVVLAGLVFLPTRAVAAVGILLIVSHNAFDGIKPANLGPWGWLWTVLHVSGPIQLGPGYQLFIAYPLVPWVGVMAAGYGFGALLFLAPEPRRNWMRGIGGSLILIFIVLRLTNLYGNPRPWTAQKDALFTVFAFIDVHKYPPSLLYLLMTLGPALILLSFLDRGTPRVLEPILVFGRVPLFYYLLHLPVIHGLAVVVAYLRYGRAEWLFQNPFVPGKNVPPDNGFGLPIIYLIWMAVVLLLYPVCKWFSELKRRRQESWLSYL
jgi:uncharacterized membrane protein